jgi:hypothetical protein
MKTVKRFLINMMMEADILKESKNKKDLGRQRKRDRIE